MEEHNILPITSSVFRKVLWFPFALVSIVGTTQQEAERPGPGARRVAVPALTLVALGFGGAPNLSVPRCPLHGGVWP